MSCVNRYYFHSTYVPSLLFFNFVEILNEINEDGESKA